MAITQSSTIDQQLVILSLDFLNWRFHTQTRFLKKFKD